MTDQTNEPPASLDPAQPSSAALPVSAALPASASLPTDESRPVNKIAYCVRRAHFDDLDLILALLEPFVQQKKLLRRTRAEIILLMHNGYVAEYVNPNGEKEIIGFSAVEIYSRKLGEIQCLAVADGFHGNGIGSELVKACVERARDIGILEVMAISSSDAFLRKLGFDYSLPEQKRALFYQLHSRDEIFNADE